MTPRLAFYSWLLAPVALLAYHFGPGQSHLQIDEAARQIAKAQAAEKSEDWATALNSYAIALNAIPETDKKLRQEVRLAHAKVRMYSGEIIEAIAEMKALVQEGEASGEEEEGLTEARATLGAAEYYAGWLMRLEGAPAEEWSPVVDNARQNFRLLSEARLESGEADASEYRESLEAAIQLARMDLSDLRGLPLPKFCAGCKNVSQKCRGQCESKKPAEKPKDARKAGAGERPRGGS